MAISGSRKALRCKARAVTAKMSTYLYRCSLNPAFKEVFLCLYIISRIKHA